MADLHRRLVDLFATEFVVHRAGAEDPNVAAAERVVDVVTEARLREAEGRREWLKD